VLCRGFDDLRTIAEFGAPDARRNFLVPIPVFESFEALNAYLLECCRQRMADSDKQGAWQSALNFRCEEE
jgi:hypothetical protein